MNIDSWLKDTITVASMTGADGYGQPTYGEQRSIKCCVEDKLQKVVNASGQEVMSNTEIVCLENIGLQDRIWLPDVEKAKFDLDGERLAHITDTQWQVENVTKREIDPDNSPVLEKLKEEGDPERPDDWSEISYTADDRVKGIFTFKEPGYGKDETIRIKSGKYLAFSADQARMPLNVHKAKNKSGSLELFAVYMAGGRTG